MRSFVLFLLLAAPAVAQPPREPKDGKLVVPLTLSPTAVKKPLTRYYLTAQYPDMKPGNRVPTFMRSYMEQHHFFAKEQYDKREKWNEMKLEDLPLDDIKNSGAIGGLAYRDPDDPIHSHRGRPLGDVDEGARQLTADWQIWFNIREDGVGTLLPEVQKMRELASVLKVRMRYEVRTGDFEKAVYSAQTFHGLSSSFESHPTLIAYLVGLAIQSIAFEATEEMIQQPGCPNLYWSFTDFPEAVIDPRMSVGSERIITEVHFKPFIAAKEPMSEAVLWKHLKSIDTMLQYAEPGQPPPVKYSTRAAVRSTDKKKLAAARTFLIDTGMDAKVVRQLPDLQLTVTADVRAYQVFLDDIMAAYGLPHADAVKRIGEIEKDVKAVDPGIARWLLPSGVKIVAARTRLRQRLAYFRAIEAIRLYAHEHDGKLPEKLADCSVPIPLDPVTGKAFEYSVKDGVATLHGENPGTEPNTNRYYEIRIRK